MNHLNSHIPLSLYIHTPWCVQKCPYCDFNSHRLKNALPEDAYIKQLIHDLTQDLPLIWGRTVQTIFIGGGTPSLFSPPAIERLLCEVRALVTVSPNAEITLEANPGTVEQARFEGYRAAGINRLSIGIQSFDDQKLTTLGRIHNSTEAINAINAAKQAGFDNFNLDLMFGLPDQSIPNAIDDLQQAIELTPSHISWYQLTLEPNTLFHHHPPVLPIEDTIFEMQQTGINLLKQSGFEQYEVSAYAQNQRYCQHNLNYWRFGDYIGIGAGAHGKITNMHQSHILRYWKIKHPKAYLLADNSFVGGKNVIQNEDIIFEFMLNALRLNQPISFALFSERTRLSPDVLNKYLHDLQADDLIEQDNKHFSLTEQGRLFLNDVLERFLVDKPEKPV